MANLHPPHIYVVDETKNMNTIGKKGRAWLESLKQITIHNQPLGRKKLSIQTETHTLGMITSFGS